MVFTTLSRTIKSKKKMEIIEKTNVISKAISGMRKAAAELGNFQDQLAVDLSEVYVKYDKVKRSFHATINKAKGILRDENVSAKELVRHFEEIEKLLINSKKIETKEKFIEQKKKIVELINQIEITLKATPVDRDFQARLNIEIEKFKIKMEILQLRFEFGVQEVKKEFEEIKVNFEKKVDKIKVKFIDKEASSSKHWDHFTDEISEAYTHLKRAFFNR
jgi:hypothetical protein